MLVAKEQRLRYLKQQESWRQQQTASEGEKLQRLKKRGESPEARLKKIRAMQGQVDVSKVTHGNLLAETEQVSSLLQEKQSELQTAVRRVEQLSLQLEELRWGKLNGLHLHLNTWQKGEISHPGAPDPQQAEPGAEQQVAAAEGAAQQAQCRGVADGQAHQRAAPAPPQERSGGTSERSSL